MYVKVVLSSFPVLNHEYVNTTEKLETLIPEKNVMCDMVYSTGLIVLLTAKKKTGNRVKGHAKVLFVVIFSAFLNTWL